MEYVKPFIIGGSIIAGAKFTSKFMGPQFAPLIGGMPTGIIASYFLESDKTKRLYFNGYMYSSFVITLAVIFIHFASTSMTTIPVNVISAIGYVVWAVVSYFLIVKEIKGKKK